MAKWSIIFFNTIREIWYLQAAMSSSIYYMYINTKKILNHFNCRERRNLIFGHSYAYLFACNLFTCRDIKFSRESSSGTCISLVVI